MKTVKFIDLFAGMGGLRKGLELALAEKGMQGKCVLTSEIKPHAIKVYKDNYPGEEVTGDIRQIEAKDIEDFDVLLAGFPCFVAGTLVQTTQGLLPIEEVQIGDEVLTHTNSYKPVLSTMTKSDAEILEVKAMGTPTIRTTKEHPFYTRQVKTKFETNYIGDKRHRNRVRSLMQPLWKNAEDLKKGDYLGIAINQNSSNVYNLTDEECWLIGRFVADGFIQDSRRTGVGRKNSYNHKVILCLGKHKVADFMGMIKDYHVTLSDGKTACKAIITSSRLMDLCAMCNKGALNKQIPQYILDLPKDKLELFLDGYLSGDGNKNKDGRWQATTISKRLVYGLQAIVAKLYNTFATITYTERPKTYIIEGRQVNQHDTFKILFDRSLNYNQRNYFFEDNMLWIPIKSVNTTSDIETVFNLEVAEDNTYTANNVVVHNCQAFSSAGKQLGFEDTRGTLFFEVARILKEKQPEAFILENVEGLVKHDMKDKKAPYGRTLEVILSTLEEIGYKVSWRVLDASEFGVGQARKRIYIVGRLDRQVSLDNFEKVTRPFSEVQEHGLPCVNSQFTQSVFKYLEKNQLPIEHLYDKAIRDKRGSNNNIHSWTLGLRGEVTELQHDFLEKLVTERRKREYAEVKGYPLKDGLGLTEVEIKGFSTISKSELEDLVAKKYLKKVDLDGKYEIWDINGGKLSFEFAKILDPTKPCLTLVATDVEKLAVIDNGGLRHLTLQECLKLQGYPKDYKFEINYRKGLDLLGNTVVVPVVKEVALRVLI